MQRLSLWIEGTTRSGKTTRLVREFQQWVGKQATQPMQRREVDSLATTVLILAANDDNRRELADRLAARVAGSYPAIAKTPVGFITDEVVLFWPLLFERLQLKAQFPLRLRPETEQELATQLWRSAWEPEDFQLARANEYRLVRRTLDLLQLAGASCTPAEEIPHLLEMGFAEEAAIFSEGTAAARSRLWKRLGHLLQEWQQWCLERGLLSYGIIYGLYWRYLLPDPTYQSHLIRRYQAVFADDTDDYPAIARKLLEVLLDRGVWGVLTYNREGKVRLGLGADPGYMEGLSQRCEVELLSPLAAAEGRPADCTAAAIRTVTDPGFLQELPPAIRTIQTTSRAALLRKTAEEIAAAISRGEITPGEIAIVAPGLDAIARYTLIEILSHQGIAVEPLNEQRPLMSSPRVRALLTLLALIYPGLGRAIDRDAVAEMLVVLSGKPTRAEISGDRLVPTIDPVRAGLLADYCYHSDLEEPHLLSVERFPRWDRLGSQAAIAYRKIRDWLAEAKRLQQEHSPPPIAFLDRAIKDLLWSGNHLPFDQLSALRELMETARHFWEVDRRLRQHEPTSRSQTDAVAQFIQLLQRGTIAANAYPLRPLSTSDRNAVTLATIFQYRSSRRSHRWNFWLDAASPLWQLGGAAALFAAPLFLRDWPERPRSPQDRVEEDEARLARILQDLLARSEERIYLCHSDLAASGSEQTGPLLPLVHACSLLPSG